jgi:hypothetical protein
MVYAHLAPFNPDRDFVTTTFFQCNGLPVEAHKPFDKTTVPARLLRLLYESHKITYADANAKEGAGQIAPATMKDMGDGWFEVGAPWLDEPEKIEGEGSALLRAGQIRDEGEPDDHHGVALVAVENGYWSINAAWLPEPEKVHGEEAARARAAELRAAGPPAGSLVPGSLAGADNFEATYEIGGAPVAITDLISAALAASGHDAPVWNAMAVEQRDGLIQAELDRLLKAAGEPPIETSLKLGDVVLVDLDGNRLHGKTGAINAIEGETAEVYHFEGDELQKEMVPLSALSAVEPEGEGPTVEQRVVALVAGNTTSELTKLAEGLPGLASAKGKAALATLIVAAGRDVKPAGADDDGGGAT